MRVLVWRMVLEFLYQVFAADESLARSFFHTIPLLTKFITYPIRINVGRLQVLADICD